MNYDVCIVGTGAGASGVAHKLVEAGMNVVMLERGGFFKEEDFSKDEIAYCKREIVTPAFKDAYHTIESYQNGGWKKTSTRDTERTYFNGNIVGGSSNFMSGYFHRLKPNDFRLKSVYGAIEGANVVDWVTNYEEFEPYYEEVERLVGVSGEVTPFKYHEPRSTPTFPYPALEEHPISSKIDEACKKLGYVPYKTPRAILSKSKGERDNCYYSNYCGSYGCSSGAKGSARASLLQPMLGKKMLGKKNFSIIPHAFVKQLIEQNGKVVEALYVDTKTKKEKSIQAKLFIVAGQAVESSRLLLNSKSKNFPNGLANNSNQVGKNLLFSAGGVGSGQFDENAMALKELMVEGLFVNRSLCDWYFYEENGKEVKGGIVDFLFEHANPMSKATKQRFKNGKLLWGKELQENIYHKINKTKQLNFEVFNDWLPTDNCFVSVDENYKDIYGVPVANIRIGAHERDVEVGKYLAKKAENVLKKMGATDVISSISPAPPPNLQAGGCRFGDNPKTSVLNKYCQAHEVPNLFVTDGSFMPTGGSVTYTWTIYANSFRVGDYIVEHQKLWI
ncbi:MAG: Glucose-methanol-choline (GMC) oxidoreductase:NAD binding site [uncultured Sulfurovum sp.]|uniref:Glucose-methanol-choline (GMC) oxidoreductase:NAD binding site n=1 Tax=uncultured Sulfurovum sp. TaxID=269237 RepID=A0A6S6SZ12_9BACT|nr:MAG: Glucose-methanol-choline (GMC) oxidoreductase:NAD binding site [uncultured Sulfurovum sp.]